MSHKNGHIKITRTITLIFIHSLIYVMNSVRQHNHFINSRHLHRLHVSTINSDLQVYFCHISHKMLCTLWDPTLFTSMEYIKLNHFHVFHGRKHDGIRKCA